MWSRAALLALAVAAPACSSTSPHDDGTGALRGALGLNDVSILYPLPATGALDQLLAPSSKGAHGELLPVEAFEHAPELSPVAGTRETLRVVSARIDPCFPSLVAAPSPDCRFQVRLVLQPLTDDGATVRADDAALHLFYDLPVGDFVGLVSRLVVAQRAAAPLEALAPLDVHPTLALEGLSGAYAAELGAALLDALGEERLTRMTFMARGAAGDNWTFGGFDFVGGQAVPLQILDSGVSAQTFVNHPPEDPLSFSGTVAPKLAGAADDLSPVYDSASAEKLDEARRWSLYETALRIENPAHRSPADVDCVGCHTAQPARLWLERSSGFATLSSPLRHASSFDLSVTHEVSDTTSALRAFGWLGDRPAISARAVNESAAVATYLNERLMR